MVKLVSELDGVFGALADPTRREIVVRLSHGSATISELAEPFEMSLPAVSKHLRVMEAAGLISRERVGRAWRCRLAPEPLGEALEWIEQTRAFWHSQLEAMADYLRQLDSAGVEPEVTKPGGAR